MPCLDEAKADGGGDIQIAAGIFASWQRRGRSTEASFCSFRCWVSR